MNFRFLYMPMAVGLVTLTLWAAGPAPTALADEGDAKKPLKELQGNWKIYREESNAKIDAGGGSGMQIDGDAVQFWHGGGAGKGSTAKLTINPTKDPKEIDLVYTSGRPGDKQVGIYKVSRGQLEISWAAIGDTKRPRKFSGKLTPGAGQSYVILRHEDYKESEAVAEELKRLEGHWVSEENKTDGLLIEGDHMVFLYRTNQKGSEAQFAVDPSKKVKQIELIYTAGEPGKRRIGIYQLEGKKLTLSLSERDQNKRPTKFAPANRAGGGALFAVYIRQSED